MNKMFELREAAKVCSNEAYRAVLKTTADWLQECVERVYEDATAENMVSLNGAWARSERVLADVPHEAGPTPPQSQAEELRMAA